MGSRKSQISMYADPTHFVYELLQNADDHGATEITFKLEPDQLIVEHDAVERFDKRHIEAISSIEDSTSEEELIKTGKFGLGFKSVMAFTATPRVYCGDENFEIYDLYRLRRLEKPNDLPTHLTRFELPFNHSTIKPEFIYADSMMTAEKAVEIILKKLNSLEDITLLFTHNLRTIKCITYEREFSFIRSDDTSNGVVEINSESNHCVFRKWARIIEWKGELHRPVEVAIRIDEEGAIIPSEEYLVVTFPTLISTRMRLILNGPYRTTPSRETIGEEDKFNMYLAEETSNLLCDIIRSEKKNGNLSLELLEVLPIDHVRYGVPELVSLIFSRVRDFFIDEEIIPAESGGYVSAKNGKIADDGYLPELFDDSQLTGLYDSDKPLRWISKKITETTTPHLYSALAGSPDSIFRSHTRSRGLVPDIAISGNDLFSKLSYDFLVVQSDKWISSLYSTLANVSFNSRRFAEERPIIRLTDGSHVHIKRNGMPSAYMPTRSSRSKYQTVSSKVLKDPKACEYLKSLGFREPDLITEVYEDILPKYKISPQSVTFKENVADLIKISDAYKSPDATATFISKICKSEIILCTNAGTNKHKYMTGNKVYFRCKDLKSYFKGNPNTWFISPEYEKVEGFKQILKPLFQGLDVQESFPREEFENEEYYYSTHGWHERGINGFHPEWNMDGLSFAVNNPTIERSAFIWNIILPKVSHRISGTIQSSTRQDYPVNSTTNTKKLSEGGELLRNSAWIPVQNGSFVKPKEVGSVDKLYKSLKSEEDILAVLDDGLSNQKKNAAEACGISKEAFEYVLKHKNKIEELCRLDEIRQSNKQEILSQSIGNREQRDKRLTQRTRDASPSSSNLKLRSVPAQSDIEIDTEALMAYYRNKHGILVCQMCFDPMPFVNKDGKDAVKFVKIFTDKWSKRANIQLKKLTPLKLVLCPVCSDLYQEYVHSMNHEEIHDKRDPQSLLFEFLTSENDGEYPICDNRVRHDYKDVTLKFNPKHRSDIHVCIKAMVVKES